MSLNSFWDFFLAFSCGLSLLFALGELIARNSSRKQLLLFWIHIILSYYLFHAYLVRSGAIETFWFLFLTPLPLLVILGALFERFLLFAWDSNRWESERIFLFKLSPAIISFFLLSPFYFMGEAEKIETIRNFTVSNLNFVKPAWYLIAGAFFSFAGFLFFVLSLFYRIVRDLRWVAVKKSQILQIIIFMGLFAFINVIIAIVSLLIGDQASGRGLVGIAAGVYICLLYIFRRGFPEFFEEVARIVQEEKQYTRSQLSRVDLNNVKSSLLRLFKEEEIYLEEDLTLYALAKKMGLTTHQLSEYLNTEEKKNFFRLVSEYRVEKAKSKISENPELTLMRIAYDSGFNSKSNFNQAFKRIAGITPTEYREQILREKKKKS